MQEFDKNKYHLGSLCKRGHDFTGDGRSLRNKSNGCVVCQLLMSNKWRDEHREHVNNLNKKRYPKRKDYCNQFNKEYHAKHKEEICERKRRNYVMNRERELERGAKYREENREQINARTRQYLEDNRDVIRNRAVKHYQDNREQILAHVRKLDKQASMELSDSCIKYRLRSMGISAKNATPELIEIKRLQLRAWRISHNRTERGELCRAN